MQHGWREIKPSSARPFGLSPWHADGVTVSPAPPASDKEVLRTSGPHRTTTDVVWSWQLSESLARSVNMSSVLPLVSSASEQLSSSPVFMHFPMLELVRECGPRPGVLHLHSGERASYRPRQKPDSVAASCQGLRMPLKPHSQPPSRGSGLPGFIIVRIK